MLALFFTFCNAFYRGEGSSCHPANLAPRGIWSLGFGHPTRKFWAEPPYWSKFHFQFQCNFFLKPNETPNIKINKAFHSLLAAALWFLPHCLLLIPSPQAHGGPLHRLRPVPHQLEDAVPPHRLLCQHCPLRQSPCLDWGIRAAHTFVPLAHLAHI